MTQNNNRALNYQTKKKISLYSILINTFLSVLKIVGGKQEDGQHSAKSGAAGHPQDVGTSQIVAKNVLEGQSGQGEGCTRQRSGQHPRQPDIEQNGSAEFIQMQWREE